MSYFPTWDANMAAPAEGWTAGALLAPNYLQRRFDPGGEVASYVERIELDPSDVEGSFRARTGGYDIRQALREVAPGFDPGPGPITVETLERRVANNQVRGPAKDEGLAPLALLAPAVFGIAAWAAAGGAAAGAGTATAAEVAASGNLMPPAIVAPEVSGFVPVGVTESGGTIFAAPELAASSVGGLTAQQIATIAQGGLKLAAAAAPAVAAASLAGQMGQRQATLPTAARTAGGFDLGDLLLTEQQQQKAPQSNSGAVPPNYITSAGAGGVLIALAALVLIVLTKG